jgi:hypothetical protein
MQTDTKAQLWSLGNLSTFVRGVNVMTHYEIFRNTIWASTADASSDFMTFMTQNIRRKNHRMDSCVPHGRRSRRRRLFGTRHDAKRL